MLSAFRKKYSECKTKHLAPETVKFKKDKHKLSQWMTNSIFNSIKHRDRIFLKLQALSNGTDLHMRLSENFKSYYKILKKIIRQAQIQWYADQFNKNKSNIRHKWSTIKDLLNKCKDKKDSPAFFTLNGENLEDKTEISCCVLFWFWMCQRHWCGENRYKSCIKTSSAHDGISARFLKSVLETIVLPLTHVINQSLCTGIFPNRLKIARVVQLFKKGHQHILDNHPPISLHPVVPKVFEKVAFNQ